MRPTIALCLLVPLVAGCAAERPPPTAEGAEGVATCSRLVDADLAHRLVAPAPRGTGLCNVDGAMTLCRGAAAPSVRPPSAHEADRQAMVQDCLDTARAASPR